ncbi:hypothetical protein ACM55F_07680 [Flavobacterium sp. XS2P12]|uniref:hypothetical protein n=1 Tax=Flavobacterium melibiosi TaxID=3398734 RepID=UPI003A8B005C
MKKHFTNIGVPKQKGREDSVETKIEFLQICPKNFFIKYLIYFLVLLLSSFVGVYNFKEKALISKNVSVFNLKMNKVLFKDECIDVYLDNIAGDTYAIKFYNKCEISYIVYYQIVDMDKIIQETSSAVVKANSGNSSGTIHCSSEAFVKIIRKETF